MEIYTGEVLRQKILLFKPEQYKQRDAMTQIDAYFNGNSKRTCALFGLRRTGKTVLMHQKIQQLNDYDHACLMNCKETDTIQDLENAMREYDKTCRYFFLDEVTAVQSFATSSSFLANCYSVYQQRILMSGTDSLAFLVAKSDTLFDRVELIHTSYIPYREFHRLLGKSFDEYLAYGGTLTDGKTLYNDARELQEYTNTAIVENIQHGLGYVAEWRLGALSTVYKNGEVGTYINKLIEIHNHTFLTKTVEKAFKSHDLGSLKQLLKQKNNTQDLAFLDSPELTELLRQELGIRKNIATPDPEALQELQEYLERIDLLIPINTRFITWAKKRNLSLFLVVQPGMRYAQAEAATRALERFFEDTPYEQELQKYQEIIQNDIKGRLLEDIIHIELLKSPLITDKYRIYKYEYTAERTTEFDLMLLDKESCEPILIEVKHSSKQHENQRKNLLSKESCAAIRKRTGVDIAGKAVIYLGETDKVEKGIMYVNAEEFLVNTTQAIEQIQEYYSTYIRNDKMKREESREQGMSR